MKDWKRRIDEFLRANSSEQSVDDGQLLNLISELIQEEKLSVDEKSILLELKNSNGSTLNDLAERSIKNSTPIQQLISYSKKLFNASSCLDIADESLTKENGTLNHVAVEAEEITVSLKNQVYQLIINYDDIEKFARTFLADFQLTLEAFKVLSDKLEAITKRLVRISNQLTPLTQAIHMLIERSNDIDISKLCVIFLKKLLTVQQRCHVILQKLYATQQDHDNVSKKLSDTRTHFLIASQNIIYDSLKKNKKRLVSPVEHAKKALAIMGFTPVIPASNATKSASNSEKEMSTLEICAAIEKMISSAIVDEKILTVTPPDPDVIYKAIATINKSSNSSTSENTTSSSSSSATNSNASSSASSNFFTSITRANNENPNKRRIDELKKQIDRLLDPSIHLAQNKRLVNLLNELAGSKSLSAAEKFELVLHSAQNGKPRVLTTYVAIALYCERSVTEKVVSLLTAMQNALETGLDEFRLASNTSYPYFDYGKIFSDILLYGEIQKEIRQELFDFLQKLGVVREVGHDVFIFLRSHEVFDVFDEPLTALCRLCLNDKQPDANVEDFDIYYYQKIADSGESLTEAEQQKLTSVLNSASSTSTIASQSSSTSSNSFSSTNTLILTKIVQSLWQLFQAIENFEDNELASLSCTPKSKNKVDDEDTDIDADEDAEADANEDEETNNKCTF